MSTATIEKATKKARKVKKPKTNVPKSTEATTAVAKAPKGTKPAKKASEDQEKRLSSLDAAAKVLKEARMHPLGKNPGDFWPIPTETRSLGAMTGQSGAVKVPGGAGWVGHVAGGQARIIREQDPRWLSPNGKNPGDAWEIHTRPFPGAHFAVYPEALCEIPIKAGCPPDGIVLDPFTGSWTTAVVAKRLGRQFVAFELNAEYVKLASKRVARVVP